MNVTALIADDESAARNGLRTLLSATPWITVLDEARNGREAVEKIEARKPDLVFLDIEMPGIRGTDIFAHITHAPHIVFTTAYAEHAVTGFELGALDYLLKPFGAERLAKCVERVRVAIGEPALITASNRLEAALSKGPISRLFVRSGNGIIPVSVDDVSRLEASGDYVMAFAGRSRHLLHVSLARLEIRLNAATFVRVHRSMILNLTHVNSFMRRDGKMTALMSDGTTVAVSRERARDLRRLGY